MGTLVLLLLFDNFSSRFKSLRDLLLNIIFSFSLSSLFLFLFLILVFFALGISPTPSSLFLFLFSILAFFALCISPTPSSLNLLLGRPRPRFISVLFDCPLLPFFIL